MEVLPQTYDAWMDGLVNGVTASADVSNQRPTPSSAFSWTDHSCSPLAFLLNRCDKVLMAYYHIIYKPSYSVEQASKNRHIPASDVNSGDIWGGITKNKLIDELRDAAPHCTSQHLPGLRPPEPLHSVYETELETRMPNEEYYDAWMALCLLRNVKDALNMFETDKAIETASIEAGLMPSWQSILPTTSRLSLLKSIDDFKPFIDWLKNELAPNNYENSFVPHFIGVKAGEGAVVEG